MAATEDWRPPSAMAATEYWRPPSAFTSPMRLRMHTIIGFEEAPAQRD